MLVSPLLGLKQSYFHSLCKFMLRPVYSYVQVQEVNLVEIGPFIFYMTKILHGIYQ